MSVTNVNPCPSHAYRYGQEPLGSVGSVTVYTSRPTGTSTCAVERSNQCTLSASSCRCCPTPISSGIRRTVRLVRQLPASTSTRTPSEVVLERLPARRSFNCRFRLPPSFRQKRSPASELVTRSMSPLPSKSAATIPSTGPTRSSPSSFVTSVKPAWPALRQTRTPSLP